MRSLKGLTPRWPTWLSFYTIEYRGEHARPQIHAPASAEHLLQLSCRVLASGNGHITGDTGTTPASLFWSVEGGGDGA